MLNAFLSFNGATLGRAWKPNLSTVYGFYSYALQWGHAR